MRTEEKVEDLTQIKKYLTTTNVYTEFLKRIRTYRATGVAVKIGVESTGNTRYFKVINVEKKLRISDVY